MALENHDDDRLFVRDGWRHYRRTYSVVEARWGLCTFAVMVVIVGWVIWRGRHPDPALFADGAALLVNPSTAPAGYAPTSASATPAVAGTKLTVGPTSAGGGTAVEPAPSAGAGVGRGPLPRGLAGTDWNEEKVAVFDEENLYVKIDGRADYFRAFHFKQLHSVLLTNIADSTVTIDVEMYDVSTNANALGAYSGERPPNAKVQVTEAGLHHFDRNALYLARGPYYIRVIGSDETPVITKKLQQLAEKMITDVGGEPLPWAYGLFIGQMNLGADKITYSAKNAFSLGFANDVWAVRPEGKETDLELFVSARADGPAARKLVGQLTAAFLELGTAEGKGNGATLVKDQFLGLYSGAASAGGGGRFVVGVRGAASKDKALQELERLRQALGGAPAELLARALPSGEVPPTPAQKVTGAKPGVGPESPPVQQAVEPAVEPAVEKVEEQ
jgi:hypothetical protein